MDDAVIDSLPLLKPFLGIPFLLLWLFVFAFGTLVESKPYRELYSSSLYTPKPADAEKDQVGEQLNRPVNDLIQKVSDTVAADHYGLAGGTKRLANGREVNLPIDAGSFNFFLAILAFTPTNCALLCCLAGLVGGFASNSVARDLVQNPAASDSLRRKLNPYLAENPLTAMLRAFAVYLIFLAGVYLTGGAPFAPTRDEAEAFSQYLRIGGTMSVIAFLVGYDPSVFSHLLDGVRRVTQRPTETDKPR